MSFTIENNRWKFFICPECKREDLVVDPREKDPRAIVVDQTCYSHLILKGEFKNLLSRPVSQLDDQKT